MPSEPSTDSPLVALVDCNNFYVSCERVFNPKLIGIPVVVLSSRDGIIVARSNEAKALGIPMGAPYFEWRELIERQRGVALASNFSLYGDLSRRVMATLSHFHPDLEIYSIDEAFLLLSGIKDPMAYAKNLREKVMQWTGIPVSIGIAKTKTLAKLANRRAKREPEAKGLFALLDEKCIVESLENLPVKEIWGIGSRLSLQLRRKGIRSALDLRSQKESWLEAHLASPVIKTALELRGIASFDFEDTPQPKKSILTSRSFHDPIRDKEELFAAISSFVLRAGEKLREEKSLASLLTLFIMTSPYNPSEYYAKEAVEIFPEPTHYTPKLLAAAEHAFNTIYRPGLAYKRSGILMSGLLADNSTPLDLFSPHDKVRHEKEKKLSTLCDNLNNTYGYSIVHFGSRGDMEEEKAHSPAYTTDLSEVLKIRI